MKKEWMEPVVEVQEFAANEYVAACGDSGKVYKFVCDAGQYGHNYNVYYYDGSGQKNISQKKAHGEAGALKLNFLDIILVTRLMKRNLIVDLSVVL